jgi:hypothetical protein
MVADDGSICCGGGVKSGGGQWRWLGMIILSNAGVCFVFSSFILLYLCEARESCKNFQELPKKSPESPQEVLNQLLDDL